MRAIQIFDKDVIADTITNDRIYPHVSDDGSPVPELYEANDSMLHIGIVDGEEYLGLFAIHPHNFVLYEVHTCLLPCAWGGRSVEAAKTLIEWVFSNTECKRLITSVPSNNALARRLAIRSGMVEYGVNPASFQKNRVLFDLIMLGISKEVTCQQQP